VAVAVDGQIYHDPEFVDLPDGAEIHLVPRVSGG
jgi:sulfur carrier protein ThiS